MPKGMVEVPEGGYVRESAVEAWEQWQAEAHEANEGRSVFKKIFLVGKKTALDLAHEEALIENAGTEWKTRNEAEFLKKQLVGAFESIFADPKQASALVECIRDHKFDHVFSEDTSGRLASETVLHALNRIYRKAGEALATLVSVPSFKVGDDYFADRKITVAIEALGSYLFQLQKEGKISGGILHVTEMVARGESLKMIRAGIRRLADEMHRQRIRPPQHYGFITIAGMSPINRNLWIQKLEEASLGEFGPRQEFAVTGDQKDRGAWKEFSGVKKLYGGKDRYWNQLSFEEPESLEVVDDPLSDEVKKYRREILEAASQRFVELYEDALKKG